MTIRAFLLGLGLLAAPAAAARRPAPAGDELLRRVLAPPDSAFASRVRVQSFDAAGKAKAQYRRVCFRPPSSWRVESSAKREGPLAFLRVSDGKTAMTAWPKMGRAWLGPEAPPDAAPEAERLESLYDLSVSTGGRVAGKSTWRLDLLSKTDGRVRRSLWIAKTSGLLLRREDYRPDGSLLRRERTTRFDAPPDAVSFAPAPPEGAAVTASSAPFMGDHGPERGMPGPRADFPPLLPRWVPDGYALFDVMSSPKKPSALVSYVDGQTSVTFAEASPGALGEEAGKPYAVVRLRSGSGRLYAAGADGVRLVWSAGGRDYSVIGDAPEADLARMADSIPGTP